MAQVDSASVCTFNDWKIGKAAEGHNGYLKLALQKGAITIVDSGARMQWEQLCESVLSDTEPCWLVFNFAYSTKSGARRSKVTLLQWIPTNADAKDKMTYAFWSKNVRLALHGIACVVHGDTRADLTYEEVLAKVSKFERDEM